MGGERVKPTEEVSYTPNPEPAQQVYNDTEKESTIREKLEKLVTEMEETKSLAGHIEKVLFDNEKHDNENMPTNCIEDLIDELARDQEELRRSLIFIYENL
jgi:predicted phage gp36 major capsid-like protein